MAQIFLVAFYQPLLNLLVFLYNTAAFRDLGIAIILLTVVIKLVLYPLSKKAIVSQKAMQDLQPKINELKEKYKDDKQQQSVALMALYKDNKINPFSSCLPILIQLPFLIAVFRIFRDDLNKHLELVYTFIYRPETINHIAFGFLDLSKPSVYIAVLAGLAQFVQAKMMMAKKDKKTVDLAKAGDKKSDDMTTIMNKQMLYLMPALTIFIGISLPGGLTFYWLVVTLLTALQQWYVFNQDEKAVKVIN